MTYIERRIIREALQELSDKEVQLKLWLSDGSGGADVSSFTEAVEQLFTDSGLGDLLNKGEAGLGAEGDAILNSLRHATRKVDVCHGPRRTIDDPAMADVRSMAVKFLRLTEFA